VLCPCVHALCDRVCVCIHCVCVSVCVNWELLYCSDAASVVRSQEGGSYSAQESPLRWQRSNTVTDKQEVLSEDLSNQWIEKQHMLIFGSNDDEAGINMSVPPLMQVLSHISPLRGHNCCKVWPNTQNAGDWLLEKKKMLLCASVSPQAGLPVCLQQQKLTVESFNTAFWMKSLCNWQLLQNVRHPWQWQWKEMKETCSLYHLLERCIFQRAKKKSLFKMENKHVSNVVFALFNCKMSDSVELHWFNSVCT